MNEIVSAFPKTAIPSKFAGRIGFTGTLSDLACSTCLAYQLGSLESCSLIEVGYEDFNFVLRAAGRVFFAKVFADFRSDGDCERYVRVMQAAVMAGVATPALQSRLGMVHIPLNGKAFRVCLMDHVEGDNLYRLGHFPSEDEILFLGKQAALIAQMPIKPEVVYDGWAIVNFAGEYADKGRYLDQSDNLLMEPLLERFAELNVRQLPHCFVHGDLIRTNIMRDKGGALWIVDFAVSNYYPRIQELAVLACNVCFDETDAGRTRHNLGVLLQAYQETIPLSPAELQALPVYIRLAHAMHLLQANYEKAAQGNNTAENAYWYRQGRSGLLQNQLE